MTGSVPWNVFSQDEVLQNSSTMLRNSMSFVLADTRNWSAFFSSDRCADELSRGTAEGAGERRGDVGSDDLLGRFFGSWFLAR